MYIFRISITKLSGGNSKKGTDLHTKGMYNTRSLEAQQKTEVMKRICLCVSLCHPLEVKNICHGVQRRDNRNKVLHSDNEVLAGEPSIAH